MRCIELGNDVNGGGLEHRVVFATIKLTVLTKLFA